MGRGALAPVGTTNNPVIAVRHITYNAQANLGKSTYPTGSASTTIRAETRASPRQPTPMTYAEARDDSRQPGRNAGDDYNGFQTAARMRTTIEDL